MNPPQADCKPSSVLRFTCVKRSGDHSSWLRVSPKLEQPTRKPGRAIHRALRRCVSLFGLAPCGVYQADSLPNRWCALTAPFQPYLCLTAIGGMFSVALSVPYGPSSYEAHCPVEFGLSSMSLKLTAITRLPAENNKNTHLIPDALQQSLQFRRQFRFELQGNIRFRMYQAQLRRV